MKIKNFAFEGVFLPYFKDNCKVGFTLAEVLITLGIIGIVAAMTLPTLVNNYTKKQIPVHLRYAYNVINNAFRSAVADYGDMKNWDYVDSFDDTDSRKAFIDKYLIPYIKGAKPSELSAYNFGGLGYSNQTPPRQPDGNLNGMSSTNYYPIGLLNGIYYYSGYNGYGNMSIHVDLNGKNKPNIYGRDLFLFILVPEKNTIRLDTYQYPLKNTDGTYNYCNQSNAAGCGFVIERNGWKIPDDYPIKL